MESKYDLLVHYDFGVDPGRVASAALAAWEASPRPPLLLFGKSGAGVKASEQSILSRLKRGTGMGAAVRLRTSRARKDRDDVDLYFTNPEYKDDRPCNFCAVAFFHDKLPSASPGYRFDDLVRLTAALAEASPCISGNLFLSALLGSEFWEKEREIAVRRSGGLWPQILHWITFFPAAVRPHLPGPAGLRAAGLLVCREWPDGSLIVATGEQVPVDPAAHAGTLTEIMRRLKIIPETV